MAHIDTLEEKKARDIERLIGELGDCRPEVRQKARVMLVELGPASVAALSDALSSPHPQVRWEAAKTLTELADPAATAMLIRTLRDEDSGIRWVAAEALIAIGKPVIRPLLNALAHEHGSPEFREAVHHVLHDLRNSRNRRVIEPVLEALSGPAPAVSAPVAAMKALRKI
ncbi:MAG TPA: HEAT repeat domain-containing protein [Phycisphaerae bacterium]|nr:HEAT repeat domain-containing protein [Phycisphaerae bacterium]HOM53845.1 HEAT repeat domain-containing protein [Phycisphaerae bacterium]HON69036.1 HEAT repeat domain-containing protein [Phycisphaerae bacterium]HPP29221.1 HEAT repeat domain-containing protein [Phycisphaerae bacterium]HPU28524.1 HEAT repeat domain-containing protein [Phycisphaerae bacterium]